MTEILYSQEAGRNFSSSYSVLDLMLKGTVGNYVPGSGEEASSAESRGRIFSKEKRKKRPGSRSLEEKMHCTFRSLYAENNAQKPHSCN